MIQIDKHKIQKETTITEALSLLNALTYIKDAPHVLLVVEKDSDVLIGTVTDGDIRRALMSGQTLTSSVKDFMQKKFHFLKQGEYKISEINALKEKHIWSVPLLDAKGKIVDLYNLKLSKSILPVDVVIMAGGRGERLYPLTKHTPKPMLKVGDKPILEINVDRLIDFGVRNINISVNYLSEKITSHFSATNKDCRLSFVKENEPLGTMGSVYLVEKFDNKYILLLNSDLLTDINFEDMLAELESSNADMIVASVPYRVAVPYAIFETTGKEIKKLSEKPTYTYRSNGGIYLFKKELLKYMPSNSFYNATDFLQALMDDNCKVIYYDVIGYWLDIGSPEDFEKAQNDIAHLKL